MKIHELSGKKILIAGYGVEGKATEAYLRHIYPNASIAITDLSDGPAYLDKQVNFDLAIKSPGIHKSLMKIPYTTATNLFFANTKGMIIGVTGTKGKSTTSSLIYAILKEADKRTKLVGNIGNPMLSALQEESDDQTIYVCELSSYQLDDIRYSPHISVIINFFPEHMNYHGSIESYWEAKSRMVQFARESDYFVYNSKFEKLVILASQSKAISVPYIDTIPFSTEGISLLGNHNLENIRAAITVGNIFKISNDHMEKAVKNFQPLSHRLERVGTYKDITFYDDAISTTPESTICAIEAITSTKTIFLGGQDRGYDFHILVKVLADRKIQNIVLFPDSGNVIYEIMQQYPENTFHILQTDDMKEAVSFAYEFTPKGYSCILSTASPSYSIWKNFIEKGNLFQRYVKEYEGVDG